MASTGERRHRHHYLSLTVAPPTRLRLDEIAPAKQRCHQSPPWLHDHHPKHHQYTNTVPPSNRLPVSIMPSPVCRLRILPTSILVRWFVFSDDACASSSCTGHRRSSRRRGQEGNRRRMCRGLGGSRFQMGESIFHGVRPMTVRRVGGANKGESERG